MTTPTWERNTQISSIPSFEGLKWLDLSWEEFYRQSERGDLHRKLANEILAKGIGYRDFTPAVVVEGEDNKGGWLFNPGMRELSKEESDRRAAAGEPFVVRYRVPRETRESVSFIDEVYGPQTEATADIEDFALLRAAPASRRIIMASCADDADLRITHIIRGQDHLTNTFKASVDLRGTWASNPPNSRICRSWIAPDGAKLSGANTGPW